MGFGGYLQANTAVDILIGPFVDETDGKTAETGLTIDVELSKNGQALGNKNDATEPVHDAAGGIDGYYNCELDSTDTNTEGNLTVVCYASGALPVRHDFMVLAQAAYISLVTAKDTGFMDVDIKAISTSATAANNLELSTLSIITAATSAGTLSTTQMTTDLTEATNDHYNGRIVIWTSGVLVGQASDITDYDGSTKMLTYTAVTEAPTASDTFIIV